MWKFLLCCIALAASCQLNEAFSVEYHGGVRVTTSLRMRQDEPERHRRTMLTIALTTMLAPVVANAEGEGPTTLHIVNYPKEGSCGQADVPPTGVFFAKNLGGMVEGPCSKDGYSVPEGTAPGIKEKDKQRTYEIYGK